MFQIFSFLRRPPCLSKEIIISPEEQIENIKRWNKNRSWFFKEAHFEKLGTPPKVSKEDQNNLTAIVVLVPYLCTVGHTFRELLLLAASQHKRSVRYDIQGEGEYEKKHHIRLITGLTHQQGLQWEVINFKASIGESLIDVMKKNGNNPNIFPCAGVLAAACHFPLLFRKMDGVKFSYLMLPGYRMNLKKKDNQQKGDNWHRIPMLYVKKSEDEICFGSLFDNVGVSKFAIPQLVK